MWKHFVAALTLSSMILISCQKETNIKEPLPNSEQGIIEQLNGLSISSTNAQGSQSTYNTPRQSSFQLLSFAIAKAGLADELNNPRFAYTLFAPTDEAFASIGLGSREAISTVPVEKLKAILLYHVFGTKVTAADVPSTYTELNMLSNQKAYVIKKSNGVFINGAQVVAADIAAKAGIIHAINRVLLPPAGTIVDVAVSSPDLSFLVAAVTKAGLAGALSGSGPFTVFAPTNQAFMDAGFPNIAAIQAAPPSALIPILTYHVAAGRVFSSDLINGQTLTMLSGGTTTIMLSSGAQIDGNSSAPSNIIQTDIMATNGVIHKIDRVLLP